MKKYILAFMIFATPLLLFSQTLNVDWAEKYNLKGNGKTELLTIEDDGYYVLFGLNNSGANFKVLKYNFQNEVISEKDQEFEYLGSPLTFRKIVKINSKIFGLFSYHKWDRNTFIAEFKDGHFSNLKKWFEHDFNRKGKFLSNIHSYQDLERAISISPNDSSLIYACGVRKYDKYRPEEFLVAVFDNQMNLKWQKKEKLAYYDTSFFTDKITVDDSGDNAFLIGFISKKRQKDAYKIFHITKDITKEYAIKLKDKYHPTSVTSFYDKEKKKLILSGFYKTYKKRNQAGIFYQELDLVTASFSEIKYQPFSSKEQLKHKYSITEFRKLSNGNYQFLASNKVCALDTPSDTSQPKRYNEKLREEERLTHCSYNQIIFWTSDKEGNLIDRFIYDRKIGLFYNKIGYTFLPDGDNTYLFFIMDGKEEKRSFRKKNLFDLFFDLKLIHINEKGEVISDKTLPLAEHGKYLIEDVLAFTHNNKMIFGGRIQKFNQGIKEIYGKKSLIFGNVELDKDD